MSKPTYGEMRTRAERIADEEVKEGVLNGLAVLQDAHGDGWVEHIDCEALDLRDGGACVLGQTYGDFTEGVKALNHGAYSNAWATDHGFCVGDTLNETQSEGLWDYLDEAWHAVLCDKEAIPGGAS